MFIGALLTMLWDSCILPGNTDQWHMQEHTNIHGASFNKPLMRLSERYLAHIRLYSLHCPADITPVRLHFFSPEQPLGHPAVQRINSLSNEQLVILS